MDTRTPGRARAIPRTPADPPGRTLAGPHAHGRARAWAAVAAGVLALSACMPGDAEPSASASAPDAPAPTATVTVTATPEPAAPADTPDYGFTFFEEAQMGASWEAMSEQLRMPVAGLDECPYYGPVWETAVATTYAFTDPENPGAGAAFFYTNGFLADAGAPFPRNAEGVGVGSTMAELMAAYDDATTDSIEDLGVGQLTTVTVGDPASDSQYVFAFADGSDTVDMLQWGPDAGSQWSHLCGGL